VRIIAHQAGDLPGLARPSGKAAASASGGIGEAAAMQADIDLETQRAA
jgi:hypothetical protein